MTGLYRAGVLLLFVVVIAVGVNIAAADHSRSIENVTDESITVDYTQPVPVNKDAPQYSESVSITDDEGTPIAEGDDYTWNASTGEVTWVNSSATKDGETMLIDYGFFTRSSITQLGAGVLSPLIKIAAFLLVLALIYGGYTFAAGGGTGGGL